eukprot:TRINITY_DN4364_c0_g1_i2.p1 TRINITY_DN4364_c0_g1~~TRINITY_DN4364_c0_g1_i2.p1  ORF type:complete len:319 (+),score=63.04 TRINITY_DN4364_c0_g1_i2:205-1161(+)
MSYDNYGDSRGGGGRPPRGGYAGGNGRQNSAYSMDSLEGRSSPSPNDSTAIANEIRQLSNNVTQIEQMSKKLGTPRDSSQLREEMTSLIHRTREDARNVADSLKYFGLSSQSSDKRIAQQKLAKDLQYWLQRFQEVSRQAGEREKSTPIPSPSVSNNPPQRGPGPRGNQRQQQTFQTNSAYAYQDDDEDEERSGLVDSHRKQEQFRIANEAAFQNALIEERDRDIVEIEKTVGEVNEIFRDLSTLVVEQGQMIDSIESNIESAVHDTDRGVEEIEKANNYQKKSRTKLCCILLIITLLLAVGGVLVWLFGFQLRKKSS